MGLTPAQLKMWSIWPYLFMTSDTKEFTASVEPTSKAAVKWLPGVQSVSVSAMVVELMSERARVAPWPASLMLVPRPMPLPAPVTRMTLSLNVGDIVLGCTCSWLEEGVKVTGGNHAID